MTALSAPPAGRPSDCIFNNKARLQHMFFVVAQFFCLFSASNSLGGSVSFFFLLGGGGDYRN